MTETTPETREKSPYQLRREAVARAIKAWQEMDDDNADDVPLDEASDLEDCLLDEGLILLPRSTSHGRWVIEVDGEYTALPGSTRPAALLDAEEAADAFLTVTAGDELNGKQVTIRPATEMEFKTALLAHLAGGAL